MSRDTRQRIIDGAMRLFYGQGVRAVSMDAVAAKAGVTKMTLYYHFRSKDDLIAAYLEARDAPNVAAFARWYGAAEGGPAEKVAALFSNLAAAAGKPGWKGCSFLRTAAELVATPGHPAVTAARTHKRRFESWLEQRFAEAGLSDPAGLARQVVLLMDGAFSAMLVHRDPAYIEAAGAAAAQIVTLGSASPPLRRRSPRRNRADQPASQGGKTR